MDACAGARDLVRGKIHLDIREMQHLSPAPGWVRRITARSRATSSLGLKGLTT
jgi:hypothetical protein